MKNQLKFLPIILFGLCLTLCSWSTSNNLNEDETSINDIEYRNVLTYKNTSYVINSDGSYDFYVEDKLQYNLSLEFNSKIIYKEDKENNILTATAGSDVIMITNPNLEGEDLGVVIRRKDGEQIEVGGFTFTQGSDLVTHGGGGWAAVAGGLGAIVDAVAGIFTPSETADCGAAAAAGCGEGGVKKVSTKTESGFFGDTTSCEYECK
jgi:hypothetical protein